MSRHPNLFIQLKDQFTNGLLIKICYNQKYMFITIVYLKYALNSDAFKKWYKEIKNDFL